MYWEEHWGLLDVSQSLGQAEGSDGACRKRRLCREESGWGSGASFGPADKDSGGLSCRGQMGPALGCVRRHWGGGLGPAGGAQGPGRRAIGGRLLLLRNAEGLGSGRPEATRAPDVDQPFATLPGCAEQHQSVLSVLPEFPTIKGPKGVLGLVGPVGTWGSADSGV